jgi:transposase
MVNAIELESLDAPQLRVPARDLIERHTEGKLKSKALNREIYFKSTRIDQITYELARYERLQFDRSGEKLDVTQASLLEEVLDADLGGIEEELEQLQPTPPAKKDPSKPRREALPAHLPRVAVHHEPESTGRACGCDLKRIGEDVAERLAYVPGEFTVERHIRGKWVCAKCQTLTLPPVPPKVIDMGIATAGPLAQRMVARFADHLPLYGQEAIFGRAGDAIPRSTLGQWVGVCGVQLQPLVDALRGVVLGHQVLHADETPVAMLKPGNGKTHRAYLWAYSPRAYENVKAVTYDFTDTRSGKNAEAFLGHWHGKLVCDDYCGNKATLAKGVTGWGCLAHAGRKFFGHLYDIERDVQDLDSEVRRRFRQTRAKPVADAFHNWMIAHRLKIPGESATAKALDNSLNRWTALVRFLNDGSLPPDHNHIENQIRPIVTDRSLCPPSSSAWKHWNLVFRIDVTRTFLSRRRGDDPFALHVSAQNLVRRTRNNLFGFENAVLDHPTDSMVCHSEHGRGFRHRQPLAVFLGGSISMDTMHSSQRTHTVRSPGLSLPRAHSHAIQRRSNIVVGPSSGHTTDDSQSIVGSSAAVFAGLGLPDPDLGVLTAPPVNRQDDVASHLVDVDNDVSDKGAKELLPGSHGDARRVPCGIEVLREIGEIRRHSGLVDNLYGLESRLAGFYPSERLFPALLELGSNQPVVWVAGGVAALRQRSLVSGLLEFQFRDAFLFALHLLVPSLCLQSRLDGHRFNRPQELHCDCFIGTSAAEGQTPRQPKYLIWTIAAVHQQARRPARVTDRQATTAASAGQHARKQRAAATTGFCTTFLAIGVRRKLPLVAIELVQVDVPEVMVPEHDLPFLDRLWVLIALAHSAVDQFGAIPTLAVAVGASVEGILEHRNDVAVTDRRPVKGDHLLAVGRSREVDSIGCHGHQDLTSTSQFAEPGEDKTNRLLQTYVGIKSEANVAIPDISDRSGNAQLAASRLCSGGIEHASANHPKFKLADAALHAQQQAVVRATRIVDPIQVDYPCFNKATKLEQVVPVASIAGEPRGVEAKYRADLASTEPRHEPLETWPRHCSAGGSTKVIIDDLDMDEAATSRFVDKIVLPALALKIGVNLRLGRLTYIDHGLTLQNRRGQEFIVRHRQSPFGRRRRPEVGDPQVARAPSRGRPVSSLPARSTRTRCSAVAELLAADGASASVLASWPCGFSWAMGGSPWEHARKPCSRRRRCKSINALRATRGGPRCIPAQVAASSIQAARTTTTPGSTST